MMKKTTLIMTAVCLAAGMSFGDVWQNLAKYKYGEGNAADEADTLLQKTPVAQHGEIEDALIAVVSAKDATQDGKACACRLLQQVGSEKCIPAVASLLNDETLSHYARLVLERTGTPKADEALLAALDKAPDKVKPGLIGSLGVRRYVKAVKPLTKLVANSDPAVAAAAISALGRIGGDASAKCLYTLKPAESLKPVHMTALLDCARSLKGSGAVLLYDAVLAGKTTHRIGALSGMLAADEKKAVALMVGFIKGDDAQMYGGVLTLVCGEKSEALTKAMAGLLATLPDEKKAALITALGARGDKAALSSISTCVDSTNDRVRAAAQMALSKIGDEATVKQMLAMGGSATEALAKMPGSSVNDILIKSLEDNKLKAPAIKALVARSCTEAVPALFKLLNDSDAEVRKAAWNGLGSLATEADIAPMTKAAFAIKDEAELSDAVAAARKVCSQAKDKPKCFDVVASYYPGTTEAGKAAIVDMASLVGNASALDVVKKAMKSGNKELYGSAVRSLAAWCNESAAGELLDASKSAPKENERILALRGYIRIAGMEHAALNAAQRTEMFKKAAELATRPDEKKLIISGLRGVRTGDTLSMVSKYLDDPALRDEAEQSAADMAWNLRKDAAVAAQVKEVANKLLTSKNQGVADRAKQTLADMAK
ncbi:MAG: HEAT repeat domain-containing protein [bacterium]